MNPPVRSLELGPHDGEARRRRAMVPAPVDASIHEDDDRAASRTIALLAQALEQIAATTTDAAARELAQDALALFEGC